MQNYPLIQLPGLATIEAEKGEVIVNPEKVTFAIGGKRHRDGGTDMLAEDGSYILSRHLKLPKDVVKSLGYKEKVESPADLSKRSATDKFKRIMDSKDKRYDTLAKKTAALMFEKNAARQDLIFGAQEGFKASKGMPNDLEKADTMRQSYFQTGGAFGNVPNFIQLDAKDSTGYSTVEGNQYASYFRPFATDPYFDIQQDLLKNGKSMTEAQRKILGDRQARLSDLKGQFPGNTGVIIEKEYAKYLRDADKIEKDDFLDKFVTLADGSEAPLLSATDEQIDQAQGFRYYNKRTGKNDLVDYRDRQNQGFDPTLRFTRPIKDLDIKNIPTLPTRSLPINLSSTSPSPLATPSRVLPGTPAKAPTTASDITKGRDMQSIVNGVQIGLLAADLANTKTKPPYYDYRPSEIAYTRFEPINTRQQERAYNIARQSIEASGLPMQVKQAQLAQLAAGMQEGVNQVDLVNYQNKLNNDNRNITNFSAARNSDITREQQANLAYVAEADRRNAQASMQRQVYLTNIMDIWRTHVDNRRDIGLVNQLSRNYDYNLNSERVQYVPGQGVTPTSQPNNLAGFQNNKIDPRYLNEEGRKAFGY